MSDTLLASGTLRQMGNTSGFIIRQARKQRFALWTPQFPREPGIDAHNAGDNVCKDRISFTAPGGVQKIGFQR